MNDAHICKALVLHCIDFRFQHVMNGHFNEVFPDGYDLVSVAGGVKGIVENNEFLLDQVQISCDLHHPKNIVLLQHEDCGAYGGSTALGENEEDFQKEQLEKAGEILKAKYPEITIQKYFVKLSKELSEV